MREGYLTRSAADETESESECASSLASLAASPDRTRPTKPSDNMQPPAARARRRAGASASDASASSSARRASSRGRKPLTLTDCERLFHLPVERAAAQLGVSRPTIARVMRANGVARWPYRAYRAELNRADRARRASSAPTPPPPPRARRATRPRRAVTAPQPEMRAGVTPAAAGGLGRGGAGKSPAYAQASPQAGGAGGFRRSRPGRTGAGAARRMQAIRERADMAARAAAGGGGEAAGGDETHVTSTVTSTGQSLQVVATPVSSADGSPAGASMRPSAMAAPRQRSHGALQDSGMLDALAADRAALTAVFGIPGWSEDGSGGDEDFGQEVFLESEAHEIPPDLLLEELLSFFWRLALKSCLNYKLAFAAFSGNSLFHKFISLSGH